MKKALAVLVIAIILIVGYFLLKSNDNSAVTAATFSGNAEDLVFKPGEGVGEVKFGMSFSEVEKILGKPDRRLGNAYEYLDLGMAVMG